MLAKSAIVCVGSGSDIATSVPPPLSAPEGRTDFLQKGLPQP